MTEDYETIKVLLKYKIFMNEKINKQYIELFSILKEIEHIYHEADL